MNLTKKTVKALGFVYNESVTAKIGLESTRQFWEMISNTSEVTIVYNKTENKWQLWSICKSLSGAPTIVTVAGLFDAIYQTGLEEGKERKLKEIRKVLSLD